MKLHFLALMLMTSAAFAANDAPFWTAICRGGTDANYSQTIGGTGVFNTGNPDGTYVTWPLKQSFYDGNIVCGAADAKLPPGVPPPTQVCADNAKQIVFLKVSDPKKPKAPLQVRNYCDAMVRIH